MKGLQYITYKDTLPTSDKPQKIKVRVAEKRTNLFNHAHKWSLRGRNQGCRQKNSGKAFR